jgi:phage baseplate assembly protein W
MRSISLPFRFSGGKVADTENNSVIAKQRIIDALTTDRFERVNRPEYGASIKTLLFDNFDPLVFADYRVDAIRDLNDYVSNAKIMDLQIKNGNAINYGNDEEANLVVRVVYRTSDGNTATFVASLTAGTFITEESTI